jgi:beta-alanine degradation protein BauB
MMMAIGTVQLDDERFRVTEWRFAPGASTGWHRHECDYVVVPMTTGDLTITTADSTFVASLVCGLSYTRVAGTEHDVTNNNDFEFVFVEVERK